MKKREIICRKLKLSDIIQCRHELNDTDYSILAMIFTEQEQRLSIKEIAETLEKDRATVQKSIKKLEKRDLVVSKQVNLARGYMYIYVPKNRGLVIKEIIDDISEVIQRLSNSLEEWIGPPPEVPKE